MPIIFVLIKAHSSTPGHFYWEPQGLHLKIELSWPSVRTTARGEWTLFWCKLWVSLVWNYYWSQTLYKAYKLGSSKQYVMLKWLRLSLERWKEKPIMNWHKFPVLYMYNNNDIVKHQLFDPKLGHSSHWVGLLVYLENLLSVWNVVRLRGVGTGPWRAFPTGVE